jgi:hypothetical protein
MGTVSKIAARALRPAILVATCLLTAGVAVTRIAQSVRTTPHVGDILAFVPSPVVSADGDARLLVHRQNQFGCVLDLGVLRHFGGSLIVETDIDADLVVDRRELHVLAISAGGYGTGLKRMPIFTGVIGN